MSPTPGAPEFLVSSMGRAGKLTWSCFQSQMYASRLLEALLKRVGQRRQ